MNYGLKRGVAALIALFMAVYVYSRDISSDLPYIPVSEEDIMFSVRLPEKSDLSDEVTSILENKIVQVLGRCGAGAAGSRDVFVVEPFLTLNDHKKSEGLIRNVNSISGELSLTARHRYSDAVFFNVSVPLNAAEKGSGGDAMKSLAKAIRPADAAYVRFVKNARKNAFEFGLNHPEIYDIPEEIKTEEAPSDPIDAIPQETSPELSTPSPDVKPVSRPLDKSNVEIYVSDPSWKVEFTGCDYDATSRTIRFGLRITNMEQKQRDYVLTRLEMAMDPEGGKYTNLAVSEYRHTFPYNVPIMLYCYIKDVFSNPHEVPFIQVLIDNAKVELRDVIVRDQQR